MKIPFNNLTFWEGRNFKTGLVVYVSKDDFYLLVLSFWMSSSQTISLSVVSNQRVTEFLPGCRECWSSTNTVHFIKDEQPQNENISWDVSI